VWDSEAKPTFTAGDMKRIAYIGLISVALMGSPVNAQQVANRVDALDGNHNSVGNILIPAGIGAGAIHRQLNNPLQHTDNPGDFEEESIFASPRSSDQSNAEKECRFLANTSWRFLRVERRRGRFVCIGVGK
jgi:hypothetical protein